MSKARFFCLKNSSARAMSILCFCVACGEDSAADTSGGEGSGCADCAQGAVYDCYCFLNGEWQPEMEEQCPSNPPSNDADCKALCELNHGDDTRYDVREPPCAEQSSISCSAWDPAGNITLTSGVYHVDGDWLSGVISDPEPLWGCDGALISPYGVGQFEIDGASSGEALYELGLRDGDIPVTLNGESLGTFTGAFAAFSQYLNGETEYTLVVLRSGTPFALSYQID